MENKKYEIKKFRTKVKLPNPQPSTGMIASKHFDIILGLDFHFIYIAGFPVPVPVIPFAAMSFDVMDYIHVTIPAFPSFQKKEDGSMGFGFNPMPMGGTVMIDGFHKSIATGGLLSLPPFTPPMPKMGGKALKKLSPLHAVIPKPLFVVPFLAPHDGEISHGSKTVITESKEQSVLLNNVFSCADVGQVVLTNPTGFFNNYLTAIVVVLPFGNPVMVGGPYIQHSPSLDEILNAWLMMGIMKGAAKGLKFGAKQLGKALTKLNKAIFDGTSSPKVRRACLAIQGPICKYLGEPVDAASGHLTGVIQGFELDGPLPFIWKANYYSDTEYKGALGLGMFHSFSHTLMVSEKERCVILCDADGIIVLFPMLKPGESFFNPVLKWELHRTEKGEYYVSNKRGLFYYFTPDTDHAGWQQLRLICNRNGFSIKFIYQNQRLIKATDCVGRDIIFINDKEGRIIEVQAPSAEDKNKMQTMIQYVYDEKNRMISFADATEAGQSLTWNDSNNKMASRRFKGGHKFTFKYDKENRCIAAEGPNGMFSYFFEYKTNLTVVTDSVGTKKEYYHRDGIVVKEVDSRGGERIYHYDDFQNLLSLENPDGTTHIYNYDERGNTIQLQKPGDGITSIAYNEKDLPVTVIQPNGGTWICEYDESGNLLKRVNPENRYAEYNWNSGVLREITDSISGTTRLSYDQQFGLRQIEYPDRSKEEWKKDYHNNTTVYRNVKGAETRYKYDKADRIVEVFLPDSNLISYTYDNAGNLSFVKDRDSQKYAGYNLFGDIIERSDSKGTLFFRYDKEGRLTNITNESDEIYQLVRDSEGDLKSEVGFDGIKRDYHRNYTGRVYQMTMNGKYETQYQYDDFGRLTQIIRPDLTEEFYSYNIMGFLHKAVNQYAEVSFERDVMGRIIKETCNGNEITSNYNLSGKRIQIRSSLGADIEAAYNPFGELENISSQSWTAEYKRDEMGLEIERLLPGNIRKQTGRDNLGRVIEQGIFRNITKLDKKEYLWGTNDRLLSVINNGKERHYEYDDRGYLTKTIFEDGNTEYRNPDKTGNLYETLNRSDRKYTKGGQLIKTPDWEYKYDDLGNLVRKKSKTGQVWRYQWNGAGMLEKVIRPDAAIVSFKYDALGRRIEKRFNNTVSHWMWDGNIPLHEWKERLTKDYDREKGYFQHVETEPVTTWVFEEGTFVPVAKLKENRQLSVVANYMGTPEAMYDSEGQSIWSCELNSYGKVKSFKGNYKTECPFRYQGQYEDSETGLYYNRFRYYSPEEGMYISQDPSCLYGGYKLYSYVPDTNGWIDPLGLIDTKDTGINGAGYDVYVIRDANDKIIYVGQTNDFPRRTQEHIDSGRLKDDMNIEIIDHTDNYGQARGSEQYHMDQNDTVKKEHRGKYDEDGKIPSGTEANRANSYDKKRTNNEADKRAQDFNKGYNEAAERDKKKKSSSLCNK